MRHCGVCLRTKGGEGGEFGLVHRPPFVVLLIRRILKMITFLIIAAS